MSDQQLRDEVVTIFSAGHETTAQALTWTFYLLSTHPEAAQRLRDEVRAACDHVLALPGNTKAAAVTMARTVDAIWHAAGDRSADFSWYTKRAILASVYSATLLFWLGDRSADGAATLAFLDRRLAGVARIGKLQRRFSKAA